MAFQDDINRILRDHEGFTGDGRGSEGALPVGDRSTEKRPIIKRDLREALTGFADVVDQAQTFAPRLGDFDATSMFLFAGSGAGSSFNAEYSDTRGVVFLGLDAGQLTEEASGAIAIGRAAMQRGRYQHDSIAIGGGALRNLEADSPNYDQVNQSGTRHVAIGGNAGGLLEKGTRHVLIGRNAGQTLRAGAGAVVIGGNAMNGPGPIGLSGGIETFQQIGSGTSPVNLTVVGDTAAAGFGTTDLTAIGSFAGQHLKTSSQNTLVGTRAGNKLQEQMWSNGKPWVALSAEGTYVQSGTTITITIPATGGVAVGDWLVFRLIGGAAATNQFDAPWAQVTAVTTATITVQSPRSFSTSGTCIILGYADESGSTVFAGRNTVVGDRALARARKGGDNVAIGREAGYNLRSADRNILIGQQAGMGGTAASDDDPALGVDTIENVAVGHSALTAITTAQKNVAVGWRAGYKLQTGEFNTFLGTGAGQDLIDGSGLTNVSNSVALGYLTRVSGDNQVQLGGTGTTPYAYAALQVRSDQRDKADIQPTSLGLGFIERIEAVEYRWDMRDDYIDGISDDERAEWWANPVKDGSKKRTRLHQGVVAQQVRDVCEDLGVDFSGLQDHALGGGNDVLTIAYEHFVPPLIRALQEVSERLKAAEQQIATLRKAKKQQPQHH